MRSARLGSRIGVLRKPETAEKLFWELTAPSLVLVAAFQVPNILLH